MSLNFLTKAIQENRQGNGPLVRHAAKPPARPTAVPAPHVPRQVQLVQDRVFENNYIKTIGLYNDAITRHKSLKDLINPLDLVEHYNEGLTILDDLSKVRDFACASKKSIQREAEWKSRGGPADAQIQDTIKSVATDCESLMKRFSPSDHLSFNASQITIAPSGTLTSIHEALKPPKFTKAQVATFFRSIESSVSEEDDSGSCSDNTQYSNT